MSETETKTDVLTTSDKKNFLLIDKEYISACPLKQYTGKIILIEDERKAKAAVKSLLKEKILGFDTEARPSFQRGVTYLTSLVQLCGTKCAYLFRLDYCGGVPVLFPIFENPSILKVGVAVKEDVVHLQKRAPFKSEGFVDISEFTRKAKIENTGLRALSALYLNIRISKNAQVSNWAALKLTQQQIVYAATDAWISRELFLKIQAIGLIPKNIKDVSTVGTSKKGIPNKKQKKDDTKSPLTKKRPRRQPKAKLEA